jgi:hypothetical protein
MEWIKRNLLFVIGAAIALALIVVAGLFTWNQYSRNNEARDLLGQKYEELKRLNSEKPHPGDEKVDNTKRAREEQARVNQFLQQTAGHWRPIPPIPDTGGRVATDKEFSSALSSTVERLRRAADAAGVTVASNYNFTFEVQMTNLVFGKESLRPLATQLGEVKAISDIVFASRVNSLDGLRRERVAPDDSQGFSDYHDRATTTNDLALLVPYDVTLHCFSGELGKLLAGFANSPYPILVQRLNVERPAPIANPLAMGLPGSDSPTPYFPRPMPVATGRGRGRPVPVINETPVKVSLWLLVVKPKPSEK